MNTEDEKKLEDTYVNLSQQGASLIHHVSTPLAIAKVNIEFLNRHLQTLITHYQSTQESGRKEPILEEHLHAMLLAPELIGEQLEIIQSQVKSHWQSINREVTGRIPEYKVSLSGDSNILDKLVGDSGKARLLLVEDEIIHKDIAQKLLSPDYDIDVAQNGEDALKHCETTLYDLILMDLYLPGMNGQETAQQIRSSKNHNAIIVGLTNMPLGSQEEHDNLNAYLSKPLTLKALENCLEKIRKISN